MLNASLLPHDEILNLRTAVVSAGLANSRDALLAGLDPAFVAGLPDEGAPGTKILSDLDALNAAGELGDGTLPFAVWLQNAVALAAPRKEVQAFQQALDRLRAPGIKPSGGDSAPGRIPLMSAVSEQPTTVVERPLFQQTPPPTNGTPVKPSKSSLAPGEVLRRGDSLVSTNEVYTLTLQQDGNLVLYIKGGSRALWASGTDGEAASECIMQEDGNLVIYGYPRPIWASDTYGYPGASLAVQDDGNVVIYSAQGDAIWATNTWH